MTINELKNKLKPGVRIQVNKKRYAILQHIVWWQAKINKVYDKYVIEDENGNNEIRMFIADGDLSIANIIKHDFQEPLPKNLEFQGKQYRMVQDEFCVVKECEGQPFYKVGDCEIWWDYQSVDDGMGLSLGRDWQTWEREDLATREVALKDVSIL